LKDADANVRRRAAEFLGYLKPTDDASLDALIAALDDANVTVRAQVSGALADIGAPALPRLRAALKKGTDDQRLAAAGALYRMGPQANSAVAELTEVLRDATNNSALRSKVAATIGQIGPDALPAVPVLLAALKGDDDTVRAEAASALAAVAPGDAAVVPGLVGAMKDGKHPLGRIAALQALKAQGDAAKAAIPDLLAVVKASEAPASVRQLAMDALGSMGPVAKDAVPPLLDILKDAEQPLFMRCSAAQTVGRFGELSKAALPVFRDVLRDPNVPNEVTAAVVKGLATMGKDGVPVLAEAVKDGNAVKRREAINQLGELGQVAKPALPALREAAKDKDATISRLASRAVRQIETANLMKGDAIGR
jgi:HEAT repeat protein